MNLYTFVPKLLECMNKTAHQNEVINRVRNLRVEKSLSQVDLAAILEVSNGQIGNIESPKFQHKYTLKQLNIIAKSFNVSIYFLLTGEEKSFSTDELIKAIIQYDE